MAPSSGYSSASGELWGLPLMPSKITVDMLLPNGIYLTIEAARETTLMDLKDEVWAEARQYPLFELLMEPSSYIFSGITQDAECEEFYSEKRRLCDLHLFQPILRLIEAEGNSEEKIIKHQIRQAIGMSTDEFDRLKSQEVDDFRRDLSSYCQNIIKNRRDSGEDSALIKYRYPPAMESSPTLPPHTKMKLSRQKLVIRMWDNDNQKQVKYSIRVPYNATPSDVLAEAVKKSGKNYGKPYSTDMRSMSGKELETKYVLKVCGISEYITGNYPICQYKYIRQCVNRSDCPDLVVHHTRDVVQGINLDLRYLQPPIAKCKVLTPHDSSSKCITSDVPFRIRILSAAYINTKEQEQTFVLINLYHGNAPLCEPQKTQPILCPTKWNEWLEFDLAMRDMPRSTKLCMCVCVLKRKKEKDDCWPLVWANIPIYDYRGCHLQGRHTVHFWPSSHLAEDFLNPLGVSGPNPSKDSPSLMIEFEDLGLEVRYPYEEQIAENYLKLPPGISDLSSFDMTDINSNVDPESLLEIKSIIGRDPLYKLTEDEKDLLWNNRKWCSQVPESLPKLLQSVKWENRNEVSQIYVLLKRWQLLPPEIALELLDSKYPDPNVRAFATKCLQQTLSDDDQLKYLLQLVTALKFEPYLNNTLVKFLLSKAIQNLHIGHFLFWHLKAEMHNSKVAVKFGLILETFCRACGTYLGEILRQTEMLEKLINLNTILKNEDTVTCKLFRDHLNKPDFREIFEHTKNPLNPSQHLGELISDISEVKYSAKRAFILKWRNDDALADYFHPTWGILFKNGDDLRQDMLTLQILKVMDDIWQQDGLDLCVTPYKCISMGFEVGMIEIVPESETVMNIQKKGGVVSSLQLKSSFLHQWLKDNNVGEQQYEKAIRNFINSFAGYCVATFILGIGDRHNDNIMIKKNGQLFHIDFGQFLNDKKKKYGIKRERVPFVLMDDFLKVVCKGANDISKAPQYAEFQELCCKAYLSIRSRSRLILNLLSMMLGAELPELSSLEDLECVRSSLAVKSSESQALSYFRDCMSTALSGRWTTRVDWVCHAVKQGVLKN